MNRIMGAIAAVAAIFIAGQADAASYTPGQSMRQTQMVEFDKTRPPVGYVQFCNMNPDDCRPSRAQSVALTTARWRELNEVNDDVNTAIEPVTDEELYHEQERWTYPVDKGDCEDYVLLKRRMLMDRGWPASALLITVVRDERGDGHAVLTVATEQGDLILDNQRADIRYWSDTGYRFEKRQSAENPTAWVWLRGDRSPSRATASAGH